MKNSPLTNPRRVAYGTLSVLIGVLLYCFAIAPLLSSDPYQIASWNSLRDTGFGLCFAIVIVGVAWQIGLFLARKKNEK